MNSGNEILTQRKKQRSQLSRKLLVQYIVTLFVYAGTLVLLFFIGLMICQRITWHETNTIYLLLKFILDYIIIFAGGAFLIGWAAISYYYISKPLRYLDELVLAAESLANPTEELIELSADLGNVQTELNSVREKALRNAFAAKEAEQRKNDLIVYLAHDLKTPLTSVIGYLSLLYEEPQITQELRAKYTGIALNKAQRLEELINEFFDITRFNLTQLTLETETVNLTRMLEQITFEFKPVLAEKSLSLNLSLEPDVELVCDSNKLERVFDNLLRNAVNYSYKDTTIHVSMEQNDDKVIIRVQNHGKTIPPEKLSRVFEQFYRMDSSRASTTGGAGLGLAIAKEIVGLHGGTISAESADESIVFTVVLPTFRKRIV